MGHEPSKAWLHKAVRLPQGIRPSTLTSDDLLFCYRYWAGTLRSGNYTFSNAEKLER